MIINNTSGLVTLSNLCLNSHVNTTLNITMNATTRFVGLPYSQTFGLNSGKTFGLAKASDAGFSFDGIACNEIPSEYQMKGNSSYIKTSVNVS